MEACALAGVDVLVATPPGYEPNAGVVADAQELAAESGSTVVVTHDPLTAAAGANALYTDVWLSMGDSDDTKAARAVALAPYQINDAVMAQADPSALFLHCLPAHRGEEVTASVIDGPHSVVMDEAENRMHTAQAVLISLLLGQLTGRANIPAVV
jgi:ornithine carbamoyltransferase